MNEGKKLENLCDAIIEDILATPGDQIMAETSMKEIEEVRAALARAEQLAGARILASAKSESEVWRANARRAVPASERTALRVRFDKFRTGDKEFEKKATLAARNGEKPTDRDLDGLADDYAELRRLEDDEK
jgi:translation initiation factor IF-2